MSKSQESKPKKPPGSRMRNRVSVINPSFKHLVWIITALMFLCLIFLFVALLMDSQNPSETKKAIVETFKYGFVTALSFLLGLAGGRAASPDSRKPS